MGQRIRAALHQDACSAQRGAGDLSLPPPREVHALAADSVPCSWAASFGAPACRQHSAGTACGVFSCPLVLLCSSVNGDSQPLNLSLYLFIVTISLYDTLLGRRMSHFDPERRKRELAGQKRTMTHVVLIKETARPDMCLQTEQKQHSPSFPKHPLHHGHGCFWGRLPSSKPPHYFISPIPPTFSFTLAL